MTDARFCHWVCGTDQEAEAFWNAQIEARPDKAELVKQARTIVQGLRAGTEQLEKHEKTRIWHEITNRKHNTTSISIGDKKHTEAFRNRQFRWSTAAQMAVGVAAILVLGVLYLWSGLWKPADVIAHKTSYGEVKHLSLPDGSLVVLNANSVLSFPEDWGSQETREVQLKGEAFFSVVHSASGQKFKVRLADNLAVEVLGTKFTITRRPQKTRIVLNEGKVKVAVTQKEWLGFLSQVKAAEVLVPGELIELNQQSGILLKKLVANPASYAAFQHNKLVFTNAPLTEVARVLKDNYGYETVFLKAGMQGRRFTGTIPVNRLDILFTALEKLYNLKIVERGKQIEIV